MTTLQVRLESVAQPVGYLSSNAEGVVSFSYNADWLGDRTAFPISLSLPLREQTFGDLPTRAFFRNLLQENDQLDRVVVRERIEHDDLVGLLNIVGADCAGAISCLPLDHAPVKIPGDLATDYDLLPPEEVDEIIARLANRRALPSHIRDPSPVAGVQPKLSLVLTPQGHMALPKPGLAVPTTHILKIPSEREQSHAKLEEAAAGLARAVGLESAQALAFERNGRAALLVTRFDRAMIDETRVIRIHQEDFAQALGLFPAQKYERDGLENFGFSAKSVETLLGATVSPQEARQTFVMATFFNLLIGNTDNHAKNHALLYDEGSYPRFAPLYDLLPIRMFPQYTDEFAFKIGNAARAGDLTREDVLIFLGQLGFRERRAQQFVATELSAMVRALDEVINGLVPELRGFADMVSGELHRYNDLLNLGITLRQHDLFVARAGGWLLS